MAEVERTRDLPSPAGLRAQVERADLPRHLALFYRSQAQQFAAVATFLSVGLDRNMHCLYLADEHDPAAVRRHLAAAGIDVDDHERAGDLTVRRAREVYLAGGFDPENTLETLADAVDENCANGYDGTWVAGENTWSFDEAVDFESVIEFEAEFDACCRGVATTALCQYSVDQFDDEVVGKALQTHEQFIYEGTLCDNPYYVPPSEYVADGHHRSNVDLMLDQSRDLTQSARDLSTREQRLSVTNRVLRHNIRNEVTTILGRLRWLDQQGFVDDAGQEHLETVRRVASRLVDLSERARYIESTLDAIESETLSLCEILGRAAETATQDHPDVTVEFGDEAPAVVADCEVEVAFELLLSTAAEHRAGTDATTLRVSGAETGLGDRVSVTVAADEPVLPSMSRNALTRDTETAFHHAAGLDTWIARWIVEASNGTVDIDDRGRVVVSLPATQRRDIEE